MIKPIDHENFLKNRIIEICDADSNSQWRTYSIDSMVAMGEMIELDEMYNTTEGNVYIG
jgi:hypothetical protein